MKVGMIMKSNCLSIIAVTLLTMSLTITQPVWSQDVLYRYDEAGRLFEADYGNGRIIRYTYDVADNILAIESLNPNNTLLVIVSPPGSGTITGTGINCPGDCEETFETVQDASLSAIPSPGFDFLEWGGRAQGSDAIITLNMKKDRTAVAYFGAINGNTDGDSLADSEEMGLSGDDLTYDGNANGVPDYQESETTSLMVNGSSAMASFTLSGNYVLQNVAAVGNPSPGDAPDDEIFPFGFFDFTIGGLANGECMVLEQTVPLHTEMKSYYKYGALPGNPTPQWYEFLFDGTTGAQIVHESNRTRILLHLCDALRGDDVDIEDGAVVYVGGPAAPDNAGPDIHVDFKTLSFEAVALGNDRDLTVEVSNVAGGELAIGTVAGADPLEPPFVIVGDSCSDQVLVNSQKCTITARFLPTSKGRYSDRFDVPNSDGGEPVSISVSGASQDRVLFKDGFQGQ